MIPRAAAALAVVVAVVALTGWSLDLAALRGAILGLAEVKANTAVALLLAGASLWLLASGDAGRGSLAARGCAAGAVLIGTASAADQVLSLNLGIDELLFDDATGPGNPAFQSALTVALVGLALLLLEARSVRGRGLVQALACSAAVSALYALLFHAYAGGAGTSAAGLATAPPHVAVTLLMLSVGVLCTRSDLDIVSLVRGGTSGSVMARRLLPVALILLPGLAWLRLKGQSVGLYGTDAGVAIHAIGALVVLAGMVLWTARVLNCLDLERRETAIHAERLAAIVDHSHDAIISKDPRGVITSWNAAAERMYGYSADEAVGRSIELIVPEQRREEVSGILARILAGEELDELETQRRTKDGRLIDVSLSVSPVRDFDGRIAGASVIARDMTERRRAQEEVAESERRFRELAENIREVFWITTPDGDEVLYVSPAYEKVFGRSPQELLDDPSSAERAIHPDDRGIARDAHRRLGRDGSYEVEYRIVRPDGTERWIEVRAYLVADSDGRPYRAVGTCDDVTERKLVEHEAAEARSQAERAKAEAERANQAKSEFLSRMSHELRTPLNAVLGFAQLLQMEELDEQRADSVDQIVKGGRHLLGLIDEVLDISRIEAGALTMSVEPVHVAAVLDDVLALVAPTAAERKVRLERESGEVGDRYVVADVQRLKQVLLNLLSNAIKYNHDGGRVSVSVRAAGPERLRILVSDTGPGIAADRLERLFAPFDRLGAERSEIQGTGLGLALSRRLTEAMGGTLTVESVLGQGTTFCVELALGDRHDATEDPPRSRFEPSANGSPSESRSLLYIEDNPSNFKLVDKLFARDSQIEVSLAMLGEVGIELARQHRPDLVLLDLHLPDIPGSDVLARLKADPRTADIPVVVLSADASPRQRERLGEAGACAFLTKPLDVESLFATVRECMGAAEPVHS